ncbi:MAG: hypothetical protein SGARI_007144 [Bacillariaceae sp.]
MIPLVLGGIVVLMLLFGMWVRSVPPKVPEVKVDLSNAQSSIMDDPALQEAVDKARESVKTMYKDKGESEGETAASDESTAGETIEL